MTSQQDNWPAWLSNDLNKIESKVVWQISFKACRASVLQLLAVKGWQRSFLSMLFLKFLFLNEARKRQWKMAMNRWGRSGNQNTTMCSAQSISPKNASQIAPCWAFSLGSNTCPQVTDLERFPVRISKDEAPTPLPVAGRFPLVTPSFSSLVRCVAFRSFSLCLL